MPGSESVTADLRRLAMVRASSVMLMRDEGCGEDFDIFSDGLRSERMRLLGTGCQ